MTAPFINHTPAPRDHLGRGRLGGRHLPGERYPECSIPVLAQITERAETPDAPPQTETLWETDQ